MSGRLEVTILGSGSSGGVPRADGNWGVCDPSEPKNRRGRCALLVRRAGQGSEAGEGDFALGTTAAIDASPDFREQSIAAGIKRIDALLMTHDHADQAHGIDDLRAFFLRQQVRIPCWMDAATTATLLRRFDYVFKSQGGYPAILEPVAIPPHGQAWSVDGPGGAIPVVTFDQEHGEVRSVGYRFGPLAYSPDVNGLEDGAFEALAGIDTWIVDALRFTPHPTHAHLERTLGWIARVKPRRAILTNMHIDMDYNALRQSLPAGVEPAFDGMRFEIAL
ncbi:MAG: phosphoribosyl 1,2-cyclic phosphodiesterase [Caulobacter sp.]|nr:phosphoribosyl 1,2-cyclic phosphodiesterase [Caulobacter sp.]